MDKWICWYEPDSDMVFQVARIPSGDASACNNTGAWGLLNRYKALKQRFGSDKDGFMAINDEEFGVIRAMFLDADRVSDAIVIFTSKL